MPLLFAKRQLFTSDFCVIITKTFEIISKHGKSPPPHVYCDKNCFTRRTATPFNSADTHGPKQVSESKFWILKSFQKFFRALQVKSSRLLNGNFWCFTSHFDQNSLKSWKNRHLRTPEWLKMDSCGFWWHHAYFWKALDLCYPPQTYLIIIWCVERNIFTILSKVWFQKISQICDFRLEMLEISFHGPWKLKNRHLRTSDKIKMDSRVVRPPCLILRIPTDPNKSSKANFEF